MSRKRGVVEIGVLAGLLAVLGMAAGAFASADGQPIVKDNSKVPAGVDYALAIECSGLATAIDSFWPRKEPLKFGIAYSAWAYSLTAERDRSAVGRDIETRRETVVREAGDGGSWDRHQRLLGKYEATRSKCVASAGLDGDVVVVHAR